MQWEFASLCQAVCHSKRWVMCDATGKRGQRVYIKQQKGYMLPHCGQVYWRYISWLFNFWENFLVEVRGDRQAVAFLLATPYQKQTFLEGSFKGRGVS